MTASVCDIAGSRLGQGVCVIWLYSLYFPIPLPPSSTHPNPLLQEAFEAGLIAFEQDSIASFAAAKEARFAEKHSKMPQIRQRYEDVMKK